MAQPTEGFNFSERILNTTKLGLIRLSVFNSVFNVNRRNNQFTYRVHNEYTSFNVYSTVSSNVCY